MMKIINIILTLVVIAVVSVSCETYDDYNTDRTTVVGFPANNISIRVPENGTKDSDPIEVYASDVSSVDRTYKVVVVNDLTDASSENYSFDANVTIPAGSRQAFLIVTGIDTSLTNTNSTLALEIEGGPEVVSGGRIRVLMRI